MFFEVTLVILPIIFFLIYSLKSVTRHRLAETSFVMIIIFMIITILALGLYPLDMSNDKPRYANMYYNSLLYGLTTEFRDAGWIVYNTLCAKLFREKIELFFLLTAAIYFLGLYQFSKSVLPQKYIGYFIIMSAGCLGFSNYGTNVIRSGVALSILLVGLSIQKGDIFKLLLIFVSMTFQKSLFIPVIAFFVARYIKNTKIIAMIWLVCLLLSALNTDMGPLFERVGFVDERVEQYAETIENDDSSYNQGFRIDFLLYSLFPLLIAYYYTSKKKVTDTLYLHIVRMYLLANAVWLLAIRMEYSDRLAYLSWFLIPFITLYPALKYQNKFRNPSQVVLSVMAIFIGVRFLLWFRTLTSL